MLPMKNAFNAGRPFGEAATTPRCRCIVMAAFLLVLSRTVPAQSGDSTTVKEPAVRKPAERPSKPGGTAITISKETTYIAGPLRKDGYVDYVAALNEHFGRGVTPENNAAVLLWRAAGPAEIPKPDRERFFKMLGIPPLPEQGDYFVPFDGYVKRLKDAGKLTAVPQDVFVAADLHYRPEGGGYVLYSVGPNGKDDGGKSMADWKDGAEEWDGWDDVVVRIRGPKKTP